jgi:protein gp37
MGDKSMIEWTDATWNPVTGCTKVSQGCKHCYAERVFPRAYNRQAVVRVGKDGIESTRVREFTDVAVHPDRLEMPLRWRRPRRIFVNSMSDMFHEDVPDDFIVDVFATMALAPRHTFQILTKRPERMLTWLTRTAAPRKGEVIGRAWSMLGHMPKYVHEGIMQRPWPLPNVWLGVSVEDQETADERIPLLLETPAAVHWISAEPLLGPITFKLYMLTERPCFVCKEEDELGIARGAHSHPINCGWRHDLERVGKPPQRERPGSGLDWVVVGGESGRHGRPFDIAWARSLMAQCRAANVPVLMKQLGVDPRWNGVSSPEEPGWPTGILRNDTGEGNWRPMLRDRKGGDMAEWPEDLRVREYPT